VIGTTLGMVQANRAAEAERIARNDAVEQTRRAEAAAEQERQAKLREAERAEGERQAKLEAEAKRKEAERNLAFAKKGNEILGSVFAGLNPKQIAESGRPLQDMLRENLGKAVKELEGSAIGEPLEVAAMQQTLSQSLLGLGEASLAVDVLRKALKTRMAKLGPDHRDTLVSMNDLAEAYEASGQLANAVTLFEETLEKQKAKLGPDDPDTLTSMNNLAVAYQDSGHLANAVTLLEETLARRKVKLGPDHASTLNTMNNLAMAYRGSGDFANAVTLLEETLAKRKAKLGPDHPDTLRTKNNLATAYLDNGQLANALPLLEETFEKQKVKLGPDHPKTLITKQNVDVTRALLTAEGRCRAKLADLGPTHIDTLLARRDMAQMYMSTHQLDDAEVVLLEVLHDMSDRAPDDAIVMFTTALLRRCLSQRQQATPNAWQAFNTQSLLGGALLDQKKYAEAEPLLLKGYEGLKAREKTIPKQRGGALRIPEALDRLIELYTAINKPDEAKTWQAERAKYPPANTTTREKK
jgi:tetratricopeptide (TPR) repeat protein